MKPSVEHDILDGIAVRMNTQFSYETGNWRVAIEEGSNNLFLFFGALLTPVGIVSFDPHIARMVNLTLSIEAHPHKFSRFSLTTHSTNDVADKFVNIVCQKGVYAHA